MMLQLRNGDYVPNTRGGFVRLELGSRLWELRTAKPSARRGLAMAYCAEALRGMPLTVRELQLTEPEPGLLQLRVQLQYQNETRWEELQL